MFRDAGKTSGGPSPLTSPWLRHVQLLAQAIYNTERVNARLGTLQSIAAFTFQFSRGTRLRRGPLCLAHCAGVEPAARSHAKETPPPSLAPRAVPQSQVFDPSLQLSAMFDDRFAPARHQDALEFCKYWSSGLAWKSPVPSGPDSVLPGSAFDRIELSVLVRVPRAADDLPMAPDIQQQGEPKVGR